MKKTIFIFLFILTFLSIIINKNQLNTEVTKTKTTKTLVATKTSNNNDIIGHIEIPNTNIDYDIVQTTNNEYYLNHNLDNEIDPTGSIFVDYRNNLSDKKLLIYGHNSKKQKAPLKDLELYLNYDSFINNNIINLTLKNKAYTYKIFSVMLIDKDNNYHTKLIFKDSEYEEHLFFLKTSSIYENDVQVDKNSYILTIQTCYYYPRETFLLINAKRSQDEKK